MSGIGFVVVGVVSGIWFVVRVCGCITVVYYNNRYAHKCRSILYNVSFYIYTKPVTYTSQAVTQ